VCSLYSRQKNHPRTKIIVTASRLSTCAPTPLPSPTPPTSKYCKVSKVSIRPPLSPQGPFPTNLLPQPSITMTTLLLLHNLFVSLVGTNRHKWPNL
jgi:hypothetical protein